MRSIEVFLRFFQLLPSRFRRRLNVSRQEWNIFQCLFTTWRHHFPMSFLRRISSTLRAYIFTLSTLVGNYNVASKHMEAHFCLTTIDQGHDSLCLGWEFPCATLVLSSLYLRALSARCRLRLLRIIAIFLFTKITKTFWAITELTFHVNRILRRRVLRSYSTRELFCFCFDCFNLKCANGTASVTFIKIYPSSRSVKK